MEEKYQEHNQLRKNQLYSYMVIVMLHLAEALLMVTHNGKLVLEA
jgi:hypothetical protein